ncbi:YheC/YheD family protein [Pseudalkalibacillus hwajinpoensis]|uniref:YheC/YheD family endospore coat-associated protein n=1 Tax=Guptibacillus hwajinpoensis TaxID=208199 RepID=UPI00325BC6FC
MNSFGIMQYSFTHEQTYLNKLGAAGTESGFKVYRFVPHQSPGIEIEGLKYDERSHTWRKANFPVPEFIYDRCFHSNFRKAPSLRFIHWLKNKTHACFLGYGLSGKWAVYKVLRTNPFVREHLPLTAKLPFPTALTVLKEWLQTHKEFIVKPIHGSQGNGIILITQELSGISVQINHKGNVLQHTYDTTSHFLQLISGIIKNREYLIQEKLILLDQNSKPFDRRVVMMKNTTTSWIEQGRAMRVGQKHSFVSNLHSGGCILSDKELALSATVLLAADEKITKLSQVIATELEKSFPPLFELGLDFGIDHSGKVWLLEANSKPGHRIIQNQTLYPRLPFQYCRSLLNEKEGVEEI